MYPFGVEIKHVVPIGSHLAVITNDCHLMMTESTPPFKRVSCDKLYKGNTPTSIPIAHCAASTNGEFLVCCGYVGNAVVASFDSEDKPTIKTIKFPENFIIHSAIATEMPEYFAFLISSIETNQKHIIKIDVNDSKLFEHIEVDNDSRELISVFNNEGYAKQYLFTDHKFKAGVFQGVVEVPIEAPVASYFSNMAGELAYQLTNGKIYVCDPKDFQITPRGELPLISHFCPLPNDLLLCVAEHGDAFVVQVAHTSGLCNNSINFEYFPRTPIPLMPVISNAQFVENDMVVCSGVGKYTNIVTISNTIPHTISQIDYNQQEYFSRNCPTFKQLSKFPNHQLQLFALQEGILVSTPKATVSVTGSFSKALQSQKTIKAGVFNGETVQIHDHGIACLTSGKQWYSDNILVAAEITNDMIVVCEPTGDVSLLGTDLTVVAKTNIPAAKCFCFCDELLAVASDSDKGTAIITIYSKDLTPTDNVLQLTTPVNSMVYIEEQNALFASAFSGNVNKYAFDNLGNIVQSTQTILTTAVPASLLKFHDSVLIIADKVFYFFGDELFAMRLDTEEIIAAASLPNEKSFVILTKNDKLQQIDVENTENDVNRVLFPVSQMPRRVIVDGKRSYIICRSNRGLNTISSIVVIDKEINLGTYPTKTYEMGIEVTSLTVLPGHCIIVCTNNYHKNTWSLTKYDCTNPTCFVEIISKKQFGLQSPQAVTYVPSQKAILYSRAGDQSSLMGVDEDLKSDWKFRIVFNSFSMLTVINNTVWCASSMDRVSAIKFITDSKTQTQKTILATEAMPRQATAIVGLDDNSVAVGDKFGGITILRLSDDFAVDIPWKFATSSTALIQYSEGQKKPIPLDVGRIDRVASFMVGEMVTSLMVSPASKTLYYTTLLGQIGVLIPISNEEEFNSLASVETQTEKACSNFFGLMYPKAIDSGRMGILNCDMIEMLRLLQESDQERIEQGLKIHKEAIMGLICRLKASAKF